MTSACNDVRERRVLVCLPTPKDSALARQILERAGIDASICRDISQLVEELEQGAGALLFAEEAIADKHRETLMPRLRDQPAWSDIPILLLSRHGADSPTALQALETLGNLILLERPMRVNTLVSAARTALRARERQYQVRAHLIDLQRAAELLQQADRRKDEFLAILAHELRNPLAPIRNSLHILQMTGIDVPAAERVCEMMERQVSHLVRLVDDLLELSRVTRGQVELRRSRVELAAIVRSAVETSTPLIDAGHHQLAISLPAEPIIVEVDPVRMTQIISNLLNNAAKYTNEQGQIWLSVRQEGAQASISVRDNGIGIPRELQPQIFEMFSQVDRSTNRSQGGLGIGLTLVRSLVEMHGGSVEVKSDGDGSGSEFIVRIPLAEDSQIAQSAATPHGPAKILSSKRVLVVDDNRDAASTMGTLLSLLGAQVEVVNSGPAALATIDGFHPTVVLLDIGMPDMDGYEVARRIRQIHGQNVTLIALTGWAQDSDRQRTREAGFDYHIVKPADIGSLQTILSSSQNGP